MPNDTKTPIMLLQEYAMKQKIAVPEYHLVTSKSNKNDIVEFHFKVDVAGISAAGIGRSKQRAKHAAASQALETLSKMGDTPMELESSSYKIETDEQNNLCVNFVGLLQECCALNKIAQPYTREVSDVGPPHCRQFTYECKISSLTTQTTENTKRQSKQMAAKLMLEKIKKIIPDLIMANSDETLTETDNEAAREYCKINSLKVVTNKKAKIMDNHNCFKLLMKKKGLRVNDFIELLKAQDEEGLIKILEKFDLQHELVTIQDEKPDVIVALNINVDTCFTVLGLGISKNEAKENAIKRTMSTLKSYISVANIDD